MNPRVVEVTANADYSLTLVFANGEIRRFDVRPYLDRGIFRKLQDPRVFARVRPSLGSVRWPGGQDLCPDTLYLDGVPLDPSLVDGARHPPT